VKVTHVFDRIYMCFPLTVVKSVKGLYPCCAGQLHSHEYRTVSPASLTTLQIVGVHI